MEKNILNYRVIIEPEKQGRKTAYSAYCPSLGITDYGDSIEQVLKSIKDGIRLAVECAFVTQMDAGLRLLSTQDRFPREHFERYFTRQKFQLMNLNKSTEAPSTA